MADVKTIKGTDLFIFEGKFRFYKLLELVEGLNTVGKIFNLISRRERQSMNQKPRKKHIT